MSIVLSLKNLLSHWVKLILTKNIKVSVQFLRSLHNNQQSHMIFTWLVKIVKQNERNSTLQKRLKSFHYRNNFETSKTSSLSDFQLRCLRKCFAQLFVVCTIASRLAHQSAIIYDFHLHNQNCKVNRTHCNASEITKIDSLSQ